jgi:predicted O-methyltransferase YrrM
MMRALSSIKKIIARKIIETAEELQDRSANAPIDPELGRAQICKLIGADAVGVELGVAAGYFSDTLLRYSPLVRLYSIDAWSDHHDSDEYLRCVRRLRKHGRRSVVLRMLFDEALHLFADESLDFIYIDGYAHTGQEGGQILQAWWPKLRKGGLFSGHDYDERWPATVEAVDRFVEARGASLSVLDGVDSLEGSERYTSWYLIK